MSKKRQQVLKPAKIELFHYVLHTLMCVPWNYAYLCLVVVPYLMWTVNTFLTRECSRPYASIHWLLSPISPHIVCLGYLYDQQLLIYLNKLLFKWLVCVSLPNMVNSFSSINSYAYTSKCFHFCGTDFISKHCSIIEWY